MYLLSLIIKIMTPQAIITFAKWQVKKDSIPAVLRLLPELIQKSIAEEGNAQYKIYRSNSEANLFILFEVYRDEQSLEAHRNSSHFREIIVEQIVPLLENREVILTSEWSYLT